MEAVTSFPDIMTEDELIGYLRIPELTTAKDHQNVVANLKRTRGLPCFYICNKPLYLRSLIDAWARGQADPGDHQ